RLATSNEVIVLARELGDKELLANGLSWRIRDLVELGEISAAGADVSEYERVAEDLRQPPSAWRVPAHRAMQAILSGRLEEAERLVERAMEIGGEETA